MPSLPVPSLIPLGSLASNPPVPLGRPLMVVGSKPGVHLHLASSQVSKTHALFIISGSQVYIRDGQPGAHPGQWTPHSRS